MRLEVAEQPVLRVGSLALAVGLAVFAGSSAASGQGLGRGSADAKVCGLLPVPAVEAHYGGKAGAARGVDGGALSICRVMVGEYEVRLSSSPPGTPGIPTSIQQGFLGITMVGKGEANAFGTPPETKDFGNVGCVRLKFTKDLAGRALPKPNFVTTCFLIGGGYLALTLPSADPKQVSMEAVRGLLERAAARRKSP